MIVWGIILISVGALLVCSVIMLLLIKPGNVGNFGNSNTSIVNKRGYLRLGSTQMEDQTAIFIGPGPFIDKGIITPSTVRIIFTIQKDATIQSDDGKYLAQQFGVGKYNGNMVLDVKNSLTSQLVYYDHKYTTLYVYRNGVKTDINYGVAMDGGWMDATFHKGDTEFITI